MAEGHALLAPGARGGDGDLASTRPDRLVGSHQPPFGSDLRPSERPARAAGRPPWARPSARAGAKMEEGEDEEQ
eukprot:7108574-Pyramimonas_sp.AAC.1